MRFSIRAKIILVGAGLTIFVMLVSLLVGYYIFNRRAKNDFADSLDQNANLLNDFLSDTHTLTSLGSVSDYILTEYNNNPDAVPEDADIQTKFDYYQLTYSNLYPSKIPIGMSQAKAIYMNYYYTISSALSSVTSAFGITEAYIAFKDTDRNRLVYIVDSEYGLDNNYNVNTRLPGAYHTINDEDVDLPYIKGCSLPIKMINGAKTVYYDLLMDEGGGELAYYGTIVIEFDETKVNESVNSFLKMELIALSIATVVLIVVYGLVSYFLIVKNITKLNKATETFTEHALSGEKLEVINPSIKSKDELGKLSKSFVTLENEIIKYTEKIEVAAEEKANLNAELHVATQIQMEDLPSSTFADGKIKLAASITPAKEVGGDFYDYFYVDDAHFAVIVADVSGKGVPAALFMMKAKELIKTRLKERKSLDATMFEVNNALLEGNKTGLFVTAFVGVIDMKSKEMECISAGHERPYLIGNDIERLDVNCNFVLGGIKNFKYKVENFKLNDRRLFVFTDGLNEAINNENVEFDYSGIVQSLEKSKDLSVDEILANIKTDLQQFVGEKEAFDDITLMAVETESPKKLSLDFVNPDLSIIETATDEFNKTFAYVDKDILAKMDVVIDEMLNNYVSYENKEGYQINVSAEDSNGAIILVFTTNGAEFDPLSVEDKYLVSVSEAGIGGFGITITRNIVDDINYKRKCNKNVLTIKKKLQ